MQRCFTTRMIRGAFVGASILGLTMATSMSASAADERLASQLEQNGSADVFVKMARDASLDQAAAMSRGAARRTRVFRTLSDHAATDQAAIKAFLAARGVASRTFWINNSLFIKNASAALVAALTARDDVAYVRGNYLVPRHLPRFSGESGNGTQAVEWGVDRVRAPELWATGNTGQGVVVANVDTGVSYTHEAVLDSYRGNLGGGAFDHDYNWFDPSGIFGPIPGDNNDHGTHTMGTMIGGDGLGPFANDIGVAPGATWIATKGCQSSSCSDTNLIAAAQWIACPTRVDGVTDPDCSKAPDIVNNSWGGGGGDPWYSSFVITWLQAGIVPVFSAGNSGSFCSTMGSPGDYPPVFGVGATDINNVLADFSSKGPGAFRPLKPNFVAPGVNVRSSVANSDSSYANFNGTSMAAPHAAGVIALMLSDNPALTMAEIRTALYGTTEQASLGAPPGPDSCAGRPFDLYPNAIYGWGLIDAGRGH